MEKIPELKRLPFDGYSRWSEHGKFMPFSREKMRTLSAVGKAPPIIRMGLRCSFRSNQEIHKFIEDPLNYAAPVGQKTKGKQYECQ